MSGHIWMYGPTSILTFVSTGECVQEVKALFEVYGEIKEVVELRNRFFVTFENAADAEIAYSALRQPLALTPAYNRDLAYFRRSCESSSLCKKTQTCKGNKGKKLKDKEHTPACCSSAAAVSDYSEYPSPITNYRVSRRSSSNMPRIGRRYRVFVERNQSPEPRSGRLGSVSSREILRSGAEQRGIPEPALSQVKARNTPDLGAARPEAPVVGAARPEAPVVGAARPEAPVVGAARPEAPEVGAARPEAPKVGAARPEAPKVGAARPEAPEVGAARPEAPVVGAARPEAPKEGAARPEAPKEGAARPEAPKEGAARPETPEVGAARPETPEVGAARPETPEVGAARPETPKEGASRSETPELDVVRLSARRRELRLPENIRLCADFEHEIPSGFAYVYDTGDEMRDGYENIRCLPANTHSVIIANIPESFTLDEVYWLVQEAKPIAMSQMDYSMGLGVKFCEVFLTRRNYVKYLIKKLDMFFVAGQMLTVVDTVSLLRGDFHYFIFDIDQITREYEEGVHVEGEERETKETTLEDDFKFEY